MKPLATLFWHASLWGTKFSPLKGRAAMPILSGAEAEAARLKAERVELASGS
jgi:hypothetical protein